MSNQRRAGLIQLSTAGVIQDARGNFSYNLGAPKLKAYYGPTGELQGFSSEPVASYIEGTITDRGTLDVALLMGTGGVVGSRDVSGLTITLSLANGKTITLTNAGWAGEGTINADDAKIPVRWEGGPFMENL